MLLTSFLVLIPITLIVIVIIVIVFWKALHTGQYDDLDSAEQNFLADDDHNINIENSKD